MNSIHLVSGPMTGTLAGWIQRFAGHSSAQIRANCLKRLKARQLDEADCRVMAAQIDQLAACGFKLCRKPPDARAITFVRVGAVYEEYVHIDIARWPHAVRVYWQIQERRSVWAFFSEEAEPLIIVCSKCQATMQDLSDELEDLVAKGDYLRAKLKHKVI